MRSALPAPARRYVDEELDEVDARNPLPREYEPEKHLVYLVYKPEKHLVYKARPTDVGFHDTRWVSLDEMIEEIGASNVEPDIELFEEEMKEARDLALQAA